MYVYVYVLFLKYIANEIFKFLNLKYIVIILIFCFNLFYFNL